MRGSSALKENKGFIARVIIFALALCCALTVLSLLLMPKEYMDTSYPGTSSLLGFYEQKKDSVDVLFLGSSHAISGFDTQLLYDSYGLRGYTMGSGEQNVVVSYHYLIEALKTQRPKAVVLDTLMAFPFRESKTLYSSAASSEKAVNFMKPGINKFRTVFELSGYDEELKPADMLLPFLRYHERWDKLDEDDYLIFNAYSRLTLHGFNIKYGNLADESVDYKPFNKEEGSDIAIAPVIRDYLDRIYDTCRDRGIELILVKTPSNKTGANEYRAMSAYAAEKGLSYLDFNEEGLYGSCGFDFSRDMGNIGHVNLYGADKVSAVIGEKLLALGISGETDAAWEDTEELYRHCKNNFLITVAETKEEFLALSEDEGYALLILSDDEEGQPVYTHTGGWETLNLDEKLEKKGKWNAVIYDKVTRDIIDTVYSNEDGRLKHI